MTTAGPPGGDKGPRRKSHSGIPSAGIFTWRLLNSMTDKRLRSTALHLWTAVFVLPLSDEHAEQQNTYF